jgi:hypothetical protein
MASNPHSKIFQKWVRHSLFVIAASLLAEMALEVVEVRIHTASEQGQCDPPMVRVG